MSFSNLTKVTSQQSPYFWIWKVDGSASLGEKRIGTTIFYLRGSDDTALLNKINSHENYRDKDNRPIHG